MSATRKPQTPLFERRVRVQVALKKVVAGPQQVTQCEQTVVLFLQLSRSSEERSRRKSCFSFALTQTLKCEISRFWLEMRIKIS